MYKVLVTGKIHSDAIELLNQSEDLELIYQPDCPREQLLELVKDCHILLTRSETTIDQTVLDAAQELKFIARACVGVGNVDLDSATRKGILVFNAPRVNTNSAAELAFGLILATQRKIADAHKSVKAGLWNRHLYEGTELRGKILGIVGLGNVGHRVAKFAKAFDMEVYAYDPYIADSLFVRYGVKKVESLSNMLSMIDILTLHVPLNSETKGMIHADLLKEMHADSVVINTSRGGVVAEKDLQLCLEQNSIKAVGIDTWENEPKINLPLATHAQTTATPHIGASTAEAQKAVGQLIAGQVLKAISGQVVDHPVNLPQMEVFDSPLVKPYTVLAEKLGSLAAQLLDFNPERVEIHYRGDLAEESHSLIRLGWLKGFLSNRVEDFVSYVNAELHCKNLGILVEESKDPDFQSYRSAIKIIIHGTASQSLTVGGLVFDQKYPRVSLINDFYFEIEPHGKLLVIQNEDKPGVIGAVGSFLAQNSLNIDSFDLCRQKPGGMAMAVIRSDGQLEDAQMQKLMQIEHVVQATAVTL